MMGMFCCAPGPALLFCCVYLISCPKKHCCARGLFVHGPDVVYCLCQVSIIHSGFSGQVNIPVQLYFSGKSGLFQVDPNSGAHSLFSPIFFSIIFLFCSVMWGLFFFSFDSYIWGNFDVGNFLSLGQL